MNSKLLFQPSRETISQTAMTLFQEKVEKIIQGKFSTYEEFYDWSVKNPEEFWRLWLQESGMVYRGELGSSKEDVLLRGNHFSESKWFPGIQLNFAENLLRKSFENRDKIVMHFQPEKGCQPERYLHGEFLLSEVARIAAFLKSKGVQKGDRVAAVLPNSPESIIGMLATTSLGAVWSSASPDFGSQGILDRFSQIEPKAIILCNAYYFKGKEIDCLRKWSEVLPSLPSLKSAIIWNFTQPTECLDLSKLVAHLPDGKLASDFIQRWEEVPPAISDNRKIELSDMEFEPITFQDPVYIMYSSGTTGLPKCIVQGAGVLLNHTKELILHCDLKETEAISYYTTCGWMMWNWVASSLFVGSKLCIFDGNPFYPTGDFLWEWIERENIHVFGTSAKYLTVLQQEKTNPKDNHNLPSLRLILSTGSPLPDSGFTYVYESIKPTVHLASISGGTDLNGCFALGNPNLPVYVGELQCRGLGMDVDIFDDEGHSVRNTKGELVCKTPFPSMPLSFWKDSTGEKYQDAYFSRFPNIWCHGDYAEITEKNGMIIYGRSDATLNPGGVRIGTADIYSVLETISEVADSVIIGQNWEDDVRIVLFVKLSGDTNIDDGLIQKIKSSIKTKSSPRHVPSVILQVREIPYTINGKKVELAVKNIAEGRAVKNANALANPTCLEEYRDLTAKYLS
jgi:acetoacetyl-CoA synthetase